MRLVTVYIALLCLTGVPLFAQEGGTSLYKGLQAKFHYGFIFAHSEAVQNTKGANPRGIEVDFMRQKIDTATWDLCHCYPTKGWSVSYFDFNVRILGHGLTAGYFLQPSYRIGRKGQFLFRGSMGLSYLTNPYNERSNPTNLSYSTRLSGYLQVGIGGNYQVAPQLLLLLKAQYQHVSNGGLKEPNKGINWPTASVGLTYFHQPYRLPYYRHRGDKGKFEKKTNFEAGLFVSARQGKTPGGGHARTPLTGLVLQLNRQVGRTSALNAGTEFYYDNSLKQRLQTDSADGSAYRLGFIAGHEFLLGKFFFSQQIGVYLFNRNPYYDRLYHRWAFKYQFKSKWLAGIGLKAHRQVADFIDIRLLYRF